MVPTGKKVLERKEAIVEEGRAFITVVKKIGRSLQMGTNWSEPSVVRRTSAALKARPARKARVVPCCQRSYIGDYSVSSRIFLFYFYCKPSKYRK